MVGGAVANYAQQERNFIAAKLIYGNISLFTEPAAGDNETCRFFAFRCGYLCALCG